MSRGERQVGLRDDLAVLKRIEGARQAALAHRPRARASTGRNLPLGMLAAAEPGTYAAPRLRALPLEHTPQRSFGDDPRDAGEETVRIPVHADHRFRCMSITDSGACRSRVPAHAEHPNLACR